MPRPELADTPPVATAKTPAAPRPDLRSVPPAEAKDTVPINEIVRRDITAVVRAYQKAGGDDAKFQAIFLPNLKKSGVAVDPVLAVFQSQQVRQQLEAAGFKIPPGLVALGAKRAA